MDTIRILVVDDDEQLCKMLIEFLKDDYLLDYALTATEAMIKLHNGNYQLVLLDLMMPEKSGLELLDDIKAMHSSIGVIMVTGFATVQNAVEAMKSGAIDYIVKPLSIEDVNKAVSKGLEKNYWEEQNVDYKYKLIEINQELNTLLKLNRSVKSSFEPLDVMSIVMQGIIKGLDFSRAYLFLQIPEEHCLQGIIGIAEKELSLNNLTISLDNKSDSPFSRALSRRRSITISSSSDFSPLKLAINDSLHILDSFLILPLYVDIRTIGIVLIDNSTEQETSLGARFEVLEKFVQQSAIVIQNALNYEEILSARKKEEQAKIQLRKLDELKSDFVSSVSHELRTPLASIRGFTYLLQNVPNMEEAKRKRYLNVLSSETERLIKLVEDLLDFSQREAGLSTIKQTKVELKPLIEEEIESIEDVKIRLTPKKSIMRVSGTKISPHTGKKIKSSILMSEFMISQGYCNIAAIELEKALDDIISEEREQDAKP